MRGEKVQDFYNAQYAAAASELQQPPRATLWPRTRDEAVLGALGSGIHYLEIGAGGGGVAQVAARRFETVTAVELSEPRAATMREHFASSGAVRVLAINIEDGPGELADRQYDVVVMNAVIEHLVDPDSVLRTLHGLLSSHGCLLITTPNMAKWTRRIKLLLGRFPSTASLDEGLLNYEGGPTAMHDNGHLHYFTYRSLSRLLTERAAFSKVDRLWYGSPPLLARLLPRLFSDCFVRAWK